MTHASNIKKNSQTLILLLIIEYLVVGYLCVIVFMLLLKVLNMFIWCMFKAFGDWMRGLAWVYPL